MSIVEMEFSHRNLDPLGRKKKGTLTPVARTFHHIQLLLVRHCLLLDFIISHISAAMCEGVIADIVVEVLC